MLYREASYCSQAWLNKRYNIQTRLKFFNTFKIYLLYSQLSILNKFKKPTNYFIEERLINVYGLLIYIFSKNFAFFKEAKQFYSNVMFVCSKP